MPDPLDTMSLVDKGDDAEETEAGRARRRRRRNLLIGGFVALDVAVGAGLLIAKPWAGDSADSGDGGAAPRATAGDVAESAGEPTLSNHLVIGDFGEHLTVQWANDGEQGAADMGMAPSRRSTTVLAAEGADRDGPWLYAEVELLDRFERRSFDPATYFGDPSGRNVTVGDVPGYYVQAGWTGAQMLIFGPVDDGYSVTFSAVGITQADMVAIAEDMVLAEADDLSVARPVFGPKADELGLLPLAAYEQDSWGIGSGATMSVTSSFTPTSSVVSYTTDDGHNVSVTNDVAPAGMDLLAIARVMLDDATEVTVHGLPAVQGSEQFAGSAIVWVEGGRTIAVSGDVDDLLAVAQAVEPADDQAWDEVISVAQANMNDPMVAITESWLIGAGDLEDSTTWTIDGGLDDDGRLVLCSSAMSNDGSSMNGCNGSHAVDEPALYAGDSLSIDAGQAVGIVATVPAALAGAVLRVTDEDGRVTEVPLREIRAGWTFHAAAVAVSSPGTATLVAADGSELATLDIGDDVLGTAVGGDTASTTAPAVVVSGNASETTAAGG